MANKQNKECAIFVGFITNLQYLCSNLDTVNALE